MARPDRFALLFLLVLLARAPAQTMVAGSRDAKPGFGLYAAETGGALLSGALLTGGVLLVADAALPKVEGDPEIHSINLAYVGMAAAVVLYPLGSAAGTSIVGGVKQQHGNFGYAYLGALLGLPVGCGIAAGGLAVAGHSSVLQGAFVVAGCLVPPVGATIGYNLSRQSGVGYGLLDRRLLPPSVGVKSWSGLDGHTVVATDVRLLTVRF
ncbi:MAG: hypothetical protein NTX53_02805 [candidate division WOR-3 bacterium]|nr:hypothetical protein [candidate division WOR-3 bacterium]